MVSIIAFFRTYVKPITLGIIGLLGWILFKRRNTLKVENEQINKELSEGE